VDHEITDKEKKEKLVLALTQKPDVLVDFLFTDTEIKNRGLLEEKRERAIILAERAKDIKLFFLSFLRVWLKSLDWHISWSNFFLIKIWIEIYKIFPKLKLARLPERNRARRVC